MRRPKTPNFAVWKLGMGRKISLDELLVIRTNNTDRFYLFDPQTSVVVCRHRVRIWRRATTDTCARSSLSCTRRTSPHSTSGTYSYTSPPLPSLACRSHAHSTSGRSRPRLWTCRCIGARACLGCLGGGFSHRTPGKSRSKPSPEKNHPKSAWVMFVQ